MFGDVRVTYSSDAGDREEMLFGVRKIHPVTPSIAVGFAGSIDVGFRLVEDLQRTARAGKYGRLPEPSDLVSGWVDELHTRYDTVAPPSAAREYGCELLVLGVSQHTSIGSLHDTSGFKLTFRDHPLEPEPIGWSRIQDGHRSRQLGAQSQCRR
jgi:Proteasome subunit